MPTVLRRNENAKVESLRSGSRVSSGSSRLQPVRPGDLITAEFVNGLIEAILRLERRVGALEERGDGRFDIADIDVRYDDFSLVFDVTGSGLDPENLADFSFGEGAFRPEALRGDDSRITFAVRDFAGLRLPQPSPGLTASARIALSERVKQQVNDAIQARGGSIGFALSIENSLGLTAQRDGTMEMLD